jgi:hypothetical protein
MDSAWLVNEPAATVCGTTKSATNDPVVAVRLFDVRGERIPTARSRPFVTAPATDKLVFQFIGFVNEGSV